MLFRTPGQAAMLAALLFLTACSHAAPGVQPQAATSALSAQEASPAPVPQALRDEVKAAERLMGKPVAFKSDAELDAYLQTLVSALPSVSYDPEGFLQSLGLTGVVAPGREDVPTLQAVKQQQGYRPGTLVNGHELLPQVLAFKVAMAHPQLFLATIKRLNPGMEAISRSRGLWRKAFKPAETAHATGESVQQRYAEAIAKLPKLGFDGDFHSGLPPYMDANQPGYGTFQIASALGFSEAQARRFATNDNDVDYNRTAYGRTSPSPTDQMDRHFNLDRDHEDTRLVWAQRHLLAAEDFARKQAYDEAELELGLGLHSLQDAFAHGQLTPCMHGVIGEFPDAVTWDPVAFYEATGATVAYLRSYLRSLVGRDAQSL